MKTTFHTNLVVVLGYDLSSALLTVSLPEFSEGYTIVNQPELGLHPREQRSIARDIVRRVNNKEKILLLTYSDYIIKELNTMILLSTKLDTVKELRTKHNYLETETLHPTDLMVMNLINDKFVPEDLNNMGIASSLFDKEIDEMNEIQDQLYDALYE